MIGEEGHIEQIPGSKKRRLVPNELYGKFSSKGDFIRVLKDNM